MWFGWKVSPISPLCCTTDDDLMSECSMKRLDQTLKYSGAQMSKNDENGCFILTRLSFPTLSQKPGKQGKMDCLISIHSDFSVLHSECFCQ